jgi:hypothetical protein
VICWPESRLSPNDVATHEVSVSYLSIETLSIDHISRRLLE